MTIRVLIRNDEALNSAARLAVTVVTVGDAEASERKQVLAGQQTTEVHVHKGQFLLVDETDKE